MLSAESTIAANIRRLEASASSGRRRRKRGIEVIPSTRPARTNSRAVHCTHLACFLHSRISAFASWASRCHRSADIRPWVRGDGMVAGTHGLGRNDDVSVIRIRTQSVVREWRKE